MVAMGVRRHDEEQSRRSSRCPHCGERLDAEFLGCVGHPPLGLDRHGSRPVGVVIGDDCLGEMVAVGQRSVAQLEAFGVLPVGSRSFAEVLEFADLAASAKAARVERRRTWISGAWGATADCSVVFVDPDNGLRRSDHATPSHRSKAVNADLEAKYQANRLTVTRQLPYDPSSSKTVGVGLFLNGVSVATAEIKNHLTGQTAEHAKAQYRRDRDPRNAVLRRAIVHFAVDTDQVFMTTRLSGDSTRFLPFNRGDGDRAGYPARAG